MNIEERIKEVDLRPSDIVKLQVPPSQGPPGEEPKKPIDLSQATGWIKNPTATKAIEQLLWRLCDEKVESGLTFSKPGRKKESVVAEIFSEKKVTGQYGSQKVEFNPVKVEMPSTPPLEEAKKWVKTFELPSGAPGIGVEKISAKKPLKLHTTPVGEIPTARSVTLHPFALNTMDDPMIRKLRTEKGVSFWVLYCKKNKYRLDTDVADCSIVTDEGTFVLSDFAKK